MKKVMYAKTDKTIHRIGFGAWQLNNPIWGNMSEQEGIDLVLYAISKGVNLFDTAPGYGGGQSERILGKAIAGRRDQVVINTKVGHLADGTSDFSVDSLEKQVLASLERLGTTYLDSVILHNPDKAILRGKTGHFDILKSLKSRGVIRAYGVSIDTYEELIITLENVDLDVIEILFNVFFQSPSDGFKLAAQKGVSLIAKVPLDSGWLTGKYDENSSFTGIRHRWDQSTIQRRADLVNEVKRITQTDNLTPIALGFILSFKEISAVIPGVKTQAQLDDILNHTKPIGAALKEQLIELYHQKIKPNKLPW